MPMPPAAVRPDPVAAPRRAASSTAEQPGIARWAVGAVIAVIGVAAWLFLHHRAPVSSPPPQPQAAAPVPDAGTTSPGAAPAAAPVAVAPAPKTVPARPMSGASPAGTAGVRHEELPRVPDHAAATIHGRFNVLVHVTVSPGGEVTDSRFESAGPSAYFGRLSLNAARHWTFAPAAESRDWTIAFQYSREGVTAHAQPLNGTTR